MVILIGLNLVVLGWSLCPADRSRKKVLNVSNALMYCTRAHICQLNIEEISKSKSDYLSRLLTDEKVDVVLLQKTHAPLSEALYHRGQVHGYKIVTALNHPQYV